MRGDGSDMTVPKLPDGQGGFDALPVLQMPPRPNGKPRKAAAGVGAFTLASDSTVTIPHGLGVNPVFMTAAPLGYDCFVRPVSRDATILVFKVGSYNGAALPFESLYVFWLAIG